jgi:hypothetical protein
MDREFSHSRRKGIKLNGQEGIVGFLSLMALAKDPAKRRKFKQDGQDGIDGFSLM